MAKGDDNTFVAVVNDTDSKNGGKSYAASISGSDYNQFIGKKIGDVVEGQFVKSKDSDSPLDGYKLEITGGCDKVGTPMRKDLDGGSKKPLLITSGTGFKGHKIFMKKGQRYRTKHEGLRMRKKFRGSTITNDTRQINLKVVGKGKKSLAEISGTNSSENENSNEN